MPNHQNEPDEIQEQQQPEPEPDKEQEGEVGNQADAPQGAEAEAPHGTDWKAASRKWEARAKRAEKAEAQLADAVARAEKAEAALAAREAAEARAALVKKVAEKHRVDPRFMPLLTAEDEAGLNAQAELIGQRFADPVKFITGNQEKKDGGRKEDEREFAHLLFSGRRKHPFHFHGSPAASSAAAIRLYSSRIPLIPSLAALPWRVAAWSFSFILMLAADVVIWWPSRFSTTLD